MKKLFILAILISSLFSCKKETIKPNSTPMHVEYVMTRQDSLPEFILFGNYVESIPDTNGKCTVILRCDVYKPGLVKIFDYGVVFDNFDDKDTTSSYHDLCIDKCKHSCRGSLNPGELKTFTDTLRNMELNTIYTYRPYFKTDKGLLYGSGFYYKTTEK